MTVHLPTPGLTRRDLLWRLGGGLGGIALLDLLGRQGLLADAPSAELNGGLHHRAGRGASSSCS